MSSTFKLIDKLKATCPHCQHRFFRYKSHEQIKFCPHCERSILNTRLHTHKSNMSLKTRLFVTLIVFVVTYMMPVWIEHPFIKEFGYIFAYVLGVIMLIAIIALLLSIVLFHDKVTCVSKLTKGVDELKIASADVGNYEITTKGGYISAVTQCPNCDSQRLQTSYWFRTNLAKSLVNKAQKTIQAPKATDTCHNHDNFLGCLNCYTQYEKVAGKVDYSRYIYSVILFAIIISNIFGLEDHLIHYLELSDSQALLLTSLRASLFVYVSISLFSINSVVKYKDTLKVIGNANIEDST